VSATVFSRKRQTLVSLGHRPVVRIEWPSEAEREQAIRERLAEERRVRKIADEVTKHMRIDEDRPL
jgi:hypothetical protein